MAIKRGSKVDMGGSSASMTDMMFLLLIFLLIATTLINNNALQLNLPKSTNVTQQKTVVSVSVTPDLRYYVDKEEVLFESIESLLKSKLEGAEKPVVSLYVDQVVPTGEMVKVANIIKRNNYTINLATSPE
ncbi:MAG: biopolymer transporter ExbD [Rikenellaceae bacterium]